MKSVRQERLSSQFREEIYNVINRQLRNRYNLSTIISVTEVDAAPDLKSAKVYVSIFDPDAEKKARSFQIIKDNAGFIRHELATILHIRTVPELRFYSDESQEYGANIDSIINRLEKTSHKDKDGDGDEE